MALRKIRTYHEVEEGVGATLVDQVVAQQGRLAARLATIGSVVAVASGKGGVGKSAVTANLAAALAVAGQRVGALDADLNGPSLARMLGAVGARLVDGPEGVRPATGSAGVRVVSMELLQGEADAPLRWREPEGHGFLWRGSLETGALREFLSDVEWGELDVLLVDVPPGTDRIARLLELVPRPAAVLLVTTPSEMARAVVSRSARLLREAGVETVGLVSNMTELVCPDCGRRTPLYHEDGERRLAAESGLEEWARIPFDPRLASTTDGGEPVVLAHPASESARALAGLARRLLEEVAG
jgi:ATP-binding protein involved in chromosome partitioning